MTEGFRAAVLRRLAVSGVVLLALSLIAGLGAYLVFAQDAALERVHRDFAGRCMVAAGSAGGALAASDAGNRAFAESLLAGPPAGLQAALRGQAAGTAGMAVLGADGAVLAAEPATFRPHARTIGAGPGFARIRTATKLTFGDLVDIDGQAAVQGFLPYSAAAGGRRMLLITLPAPSIDSLTRPALVNSLGALPGAAYVLDSSDQVIAATGTGLLGRPLADAGLGRALHRSATGTVDGSFYAAGPVAGTTWRMVLTADDGALTEPVQSAQTVAWQVFAAFTGTMLLLLAIGAAAMTNAARLARARLYDSLTGLPNRSLFLTRTGRAIARRRPQDGLLAALFIDLDGFKPVNDTYGHASGDALLQQVAERLRLAVRPGDDVARFGGDEFIVLCTGLPDEAQAFAVADRIQRAIAEPFAIGGHTLRIGTSIGIGFHDRGATADDLVHRADLAMYRAKNAGKGRTEAFAHA